MRLKETRAAASGGIEAADAVGIIRHPGGFKAKQCGAAFAHGGGGIVRRWGEIEAGGFGAAVLLYDGKEFITAPRIAHGGPWVG